MQDVGIAQISASFDAEQDRLVLRLRTTDNAELRCWITRRYLRLLWGVLLDLARGFAAPAAGTDILRQDCLADFAHGKALAEADFQTPYQQGESYPLGSEPFLAGKISVKSNPDQLRSLLIEPLKGPGIQLNLNEGLTHMLARLLLDTANLAEWDLALRLDFGPATPVGQRSILH